MGDIPALAANITENGLLQPPAILEDGTLIGGDRRVKAFQYNEAIGEPRRREQYKGWAEIPVHIVDPENPLAGEFSENAARKDFTPSELYNITRAIKEREAAKAAERRGTRTDLGVNYPEVAGRTRDKLAAIGNMSGSSFDRLQAFDAATESPELYGDIAEELDRTQNINEAWVKFRHRQKRNKYPKDRPLPPEGKFETAVVDPAWPMERINLVVAPSPKELDYDTMTLDEIKDFYLDYVLPSLADDAHVLTWTTQKFLPFTIKLMEEIGLTYVLTMVWHKTTGMQPLNLPKYNCEFVVYARKGSPKFIDTKDFPCCFHGESREHSRKPNEFYDRIRRVTAGPRIDFFSREAREGFVQFGDELKRFIDQKPKPSRNLDPILLEALGL
jgi:N6-adenosine-specific RNA methylase IME4